jgi:hypothetical protein
VPEAQSRHRLTPTSRRARCTGRSGSAAHVGLRVGPAARPGSSAGAACLPDLGEKISKLLRLIPQLSLPLIIAGLLDLLIDAFRRQVGNQLFLCASMLAHNLGRELQMAAQERNRKQSDGRRALWDFRKLTTLCQGLVLRAGRLTKPGNDLTLTMSANQAVAGEVAHLMQRLAA